MAKWDSMLSIVWMLSSKNSMTAQQISEKLEISIRTVYRYIDALCASGVPIIADSGHNGGYRLLDEFIEAPLFFDMEEQKALVHAARFAEEAGYPYGEALNRAITKLKRYTNPEKLDVIDRHITNFDVISPLPNSGLESSLQELEIAAGEGYSLSMEYQKGDVSSSKRLIDPYGLLNWKNKWYTVAYCHLRQEIRSFRVDRIASLTRTELVFQRPVDFSVRNFFLQNLLPNLENKDELISVHIKGNKLAINDLCDHWLFGHALIERKEDQVHFKLDERIIFTYVPYFLLPYGTAIQVLEPLILQARMVSVIQKLLTHYQKTELD